MSKFYLLIAALSAVWPCLALAANADDAAPK
jgi:hypothetical protein